MDCLSSLRQQTSCRRIQCDSLEEIQEKFREEHKTELNRYYAAKRFWTNTQKKRRPTAASCGEYDRLSAGCRSRQPALNSLNADLNELKQIQWCVNLVRQYAILLQTVGSL